LINRNYGNVAHLVERQASNQIVVLGKTFNAIFHLGVKQSTRCGGPA